MMERIKDCYDNSCQTGPPTGFKRELNDVRAQNVPMHRFFLNLPRRKVMIYFCQKDKKKWGVTDFVLERTCSEKYPKSEKSGFVS